MSDEKRLNPAYLILTERLFLRCYQPENAAELIAVMATNQDHLSRWLPWVAEIQTLEEKADLLRTFRSQFDTNEQFIYGVFERESEKLIGGAGLHPRCGLGGIEVGYWLAQEHTGRGLATECTSALIRLAFEVHDVKFVEIRCEEENTSSRGIPERLSFTQEATLRMRPMGSLDNLKNQALYSMLATEYASSPSASARIQAFDVLGMQLL